MTLSDCGGEQIAFARRGDLGCRVRFYTSLFTEVRFGRLVNSCVPANKKIGQEPLPVPARFARSELV